MAEHRIDGSKALVLAAAVAQVRALEAEIAALQAEREALATAVVAEAEIAVGRPLPQPVTFREDGDELVIIWNGAELPV